jgi:hypothetical protein
MTMRYALTLLGLLLFAAPAAAQTPISGAERLAWEQDAPDQATVDAYGFNAYVDGVLDSTVQVIQCVENALTMYNCEGLIPALTPGPHDLYITAFIPTVEGDVESLPSNTISVLMVVAPATPRNLRIF